MGNENIDKQPQRIDFYKAEDLVAIIFKDLKLGNQRLDVKGYKRIEIKLYEHY